MLEQRIAGEEYEARWNRVQAACRARGFDGVLVWSRGGATTDSYADVLYLANHYTLFPLVRDRPPLWAGMSSAALVLPVDDEPTLIVDVPDWRRDLVMVDDVRPSNDIPLATAEVLRDRGLGSGRVGLVAGTTMLVSSYERLRGEAPDVEFVHDDEMLEAIRAMKSPAELELLREASAVGGDVVTAVIDAALKPGGSEAAAAAAGYALGVERGVAMYDVAVSSGPYSDFYAYGRLPSWTLRTLEPGDIFHVDCYGAVNGYLFDLARSCVVGARPTPEQRDVLEAVVDAVRAGVAAIRPGIKGSAVFEVVRESLARRGLDSGHGVAGATEVPNPEIQDFGIGVHGHSIGLGWEAPWLIPDEDMRIEAGMCIAVEATAGAPHAGSACFEQVVIVSESDAELITTLPETYW